MLKVLNQAKATKLKKTNVLVKPGQKLLFIWVGHLEKAPPACHQLFDQSLQSVLVFSFGCHDNGVVARLGWCRWHHFFAIILELTHTYTQYHISELAVHSASALRVSSYKGDQLRSWSKQESVLLHDYLVKVLIIRIRTITSQLILQNDILSFRIILL